MYRTKYETGAHGAFTSVMQISRMFCVAPLRFAPTGVQVWRALWIVGIIYTAATSILFTCEDIWSFYQPKSLILRITWAVDRFTNIMIHFTGAYQAASRMNLFLKNLQILNKINENLSNCKVEKMERKTDLIVKLYCVMKCVLSMITFTIITWVRFYVSDGLNAAFLIWYTALSFHSSVVPFLLSYQFVVQLLRVYYTVKKINARFPQVQDNSVSFALENRSTVWKLRELALSYSSVCNIVTQMTETQEVTLFLSVIYMFVRLEWVLYAFLTWKYDTDILSILFMITNIVSWLLIFICSVFLIETCHRTHEEMDRTEIEIWRLSQSSILAEKVTNELALFRRLVRMNKPTFSTLGVCTLARPLLVKIIGALISYLVTLLQLSK